MVLRILIFTFIFSQTSFSKTTKDLLKLYRQKKYDDIIEYVEDRDEDAKITELEILGLTFEKEKDWEEVLIIYGSKLPKKLLSEKRISRVRKDKKIRKYLLKKMKALKFLLVSEINSTEEKEYIKENQTYVNYRNKFDRIFDHLRRKKYELKTINKWKREITSRLQISRKWASHFYFSSGLLSWQDPIRVKTLTGSNPGSELELLATFATTAIGLGYKNTNNKYSYGIEVKGVLGSATLSGAEQTSLTFQGSRTINTVGVIANIFGTRVLRTKEVELGVVIPFVYRQLDITTADYEGLNQSVFSFGLTSLLEWSISKKWTLENKIGLMKDFNDLYWGLSFRYNFI